MDKAVQTVVPAIVHVEAEVVTGYDKGGEDLYLVFTCEVDGDTAPVDFEFQCDLNLERDAGYTVQVRRAGDENFNDVDHLGDHDYTCWPGEVRYHTNHYEFVWVGTRDTALELVKAKLADARNWHFCHRPGEPAELRFRYCHFVDGNAD